CKKADARGIRVTGSELVGLIPLKAMLDAGKYFLQKQQRSIGVSEKELIKIAVKSMGLDELGPFDPEKKIIEYMLANNSKNELLKLVDADTQAFNRIMSAFALPKGTDEEKAARTQAIQEATKHAIEIPFKVMQIAYSSMETIKAMATIGNPNSVSDAGVGALC